MSALWITCRMAELTQIHSTKSPDAISIVFVHGPGGDARRTWMYTPRDDATLWPKWVGEDANCNVWTWDTFATVDAQQAHMNLLGPGPVHSKDTPRDAGRSLRARLGA